MIHEYSNDFFDDDDDILAQAKDAEYWEEIEDYFYKTYRDPESEKDWEELNWFEKDKVQMAFDALKQQQKEDREYVEEIRSVR